jgi:CheY-like chemotaxis protein
MTAKELLEDEGYEVVTHRLAFGATNSIKKNNPDLILLDINMPGLSGERFSTLLLSNHETKDVPVVFYSSNDEDSLREAVLTHGINGYICKGDIFELKKKVNLYIGQPPDIGRERQ